MMNHLSGWFTGLFTVGGFLYFMAGFGAAYGVECVRAKLRHRSITIPWHVAGVVVAVAAIIVTTFQTQAAYTTAKQTAVEVQLCQKEFNASLRNRSRIIAENDDISLQQRKILFQWIHGLIFPSPPYDVMELDDPRREQHALIITIGTENDLRALFVRQEQLQAERAANPLPDPLCGRG